MTNVLFLCVANSARSQMAEGLARNLFPSDWTVQSAGSGATDVHPLATKAMKEIGLDITSQWSKSVQEIDPDTVDVVITLCQQEVCPAFLGEAEKLHWPFPDPAALGASPLEGFIVARDQIKDKLQEWLKNRQD